MLALNALMQPAAMPCLSVFTSAARTSGSPTSRVPRMVMHIRVVIRDPQCLGFFDLPGMFAHVIRLKVLNSDGHALNISGYKKQLIGCAGA